MISLFVLARRVVGDCGSRRIRRNGLRHSFVVRAAGRRCRRVAFVNRDVEAALAELFFYVDDAGGLVGEEVIAHPLHLPPREAGLGDVDSGSGQVRADDIAFSVGCIVVHAHEVLLVLDGAHGGTYDERFVELGLVCAGEIREEIGGPLTAITPLVGQTGIHHEAGSFWNANECATGNAVLQIDVVFDALEGFELNALVLAHERIVSSAESIAAVDAGDIQGSDLAHGGGCRSSNRRRGEWVAGAGDRG